MGLPQEMFLRPKLCAYLFGNGTLDDALGVMANFDSAMDEPVMLMPGNELDVDPPGEWPSGNSY